MLNAFASVRATAFHVTLLNIKGIEQGYQSNRSLAEMRGTSGGGWTRRTRPVTAWLSGPNR
jgi:hypothetical protein